MPNETKEQHIRRQSINRFLSFDQEKMIQTLSLDHDEKTIRIRFLQKEYTIDRTGGDIFVEGKPADLDEMAAIYEFLTTAEEIPFPRNSWVSIAQLCTNTTDTSLDRYIGYLKPFKDNIELMEKACISLGGEKENKGDVSYVIPVMDGIKVWFQYWIADDEFPASIQFLFDSGITRYFRWSILWNLMTCMTKRMKESVGIEEL